MMLYNQFNNSIYTPYVFLLTRGTRTAPIHPRAFDLPEREWWWWWWWWWKWYVCHHVDVDVSALFAQSVLGPLVVWDVCVTVCIKCVTTVFCEAICACERNGLQVQFLCTSCYQQASRYKLKWRPSRSSWKSVWPSVDKKMRVRQRKGTASTWVTTSLLSSRVQVLGKGYVPHKGHPFVYTGHRYIRPRSNIKYDRALGGQKRSWLSLSP